MTVTSGGRSIVTEKRSSSGYLSQNHPRQLIAIGASTSANVEIVWPSGRRQKLTGVAAGNTVTVEEPGS